MGRIWRVVSDTLSTEELSKRRLAKGSGESAAAALLQDASAFRQALDTVCYWKIRSAWRTN